MLKLEKILLSRVFYIKIEILNFKSFVESYITTVFYTSRPLHFAMSLLYTADDTSNSTHLFITHGITKESNKLS
jgi:hypothetical protein